MHGKIGHYLRENEWLMAIKNRAGIPGGVCEFDLPGYHHWLHKDSVLRRHDIGAKAQSLMLEASEMAAGAGDAESATRFATAV